jgi:hypothetical protein
MPKEDKLEVHAAERGNKLDSSHRLLRNGILAASGHSPHFAQFRLILLASSTVPMKSFTSLYHISRVSQSQSCFRAVTRSLCLWALLVNSVPLV